MGLSTKSLSFSSTATFDLRKRHENRKGLGWLVTAFFIVGDLAGGGIVALPTALMQADFYPGLAITLVMTGVVMYTAYVLGLSWVILQKRWPEYRQHCRKPYAEIGARAMGPVVKAFVSACIDVTQFGVAVVFLLLSSKNIRDFLEATFDIQFSFCYIILIVGLCLLPLTFLKSPQDFWWAVVLAMVTTTGAVVLVIIGSIIDFSTCRPVMAINEKPVITNYLLSLGTILFAYGGHAAFPTIQHDMRKPYHFTRSAILAFILMGLLYTPVSVVGYVTYGNSLRESIINSIQTISIQQTVNLLITLHCILTLTIVFNPLNQEAEDLFRIPQEWCWQRVVLRASVMAAVVFVAESVPSFGPLLDIVGSSTLTLTSLVLPCLFYLFLAANDEIYTEKGGESFDQPLTLLEVFRRSPRIRLAMCSFVILFGLLGGSAATYSGVRELATTQFTAPCYVRAFMKHDDAVVVRNLNCCGRYQNVSRIGDPSLCNPFKDFYNQQ